MEFEGKTCVVTGGAMGIGLACAALFHARGANVVIGDVDEEAGAAAAAGMGARAVFAPCDVTNMKAVEAMAARAVDRFGGVDILIANAARALGGAVDTIDEATWTTVIDTNLTGVFRAMRVCAPLMKARGGGAIVAMSSVQGMRGFPGWSAYAAAKGAIDALVRQSAVDLAPAKIRVNAIAPGTIMTPLNENLFASMDDPSELIARWNAAHPLGRFGQPEEVAEAALFLASDRASFVTGEIVRVDGGLAIKGA